MYVKINVLMYGTLTSSNFAILITSIIEKKFQPYKILLYVIMSHNQGKLFP